MREIQEFKQLKYKRDESYFKDGYMSYEVFWRKRVWYVNAVYNSEDIVNNGTTGDYTNGVKAFEILDDKYKIIKEISIKKKEAILSVLPVEAYIMNNL